ncbi:hypothetical protein TGARI_372470 [Toxoplasma gondii ARI]|uniref:Uncharacterized protein n=1 Tax=Toxoplasma gondii ARI TaxID=1074872 RepID=A0A139XI96_TOXGO|nr:hypothetical protein TGARI_372470 [Toxoplasma gondii ARI]
MFHLTSVPDYAFCRTKGQKCTNGFRCSTAHTQWVLSPFTTPSDLTCVLKSPGSLHRSAPRKGQTHPTPHREHLTVSDIIDTNVEYKGLPLANYKTMLSPNVPGSVLEPSKRCEGSQYSYITPR